MPKFVESFPLVDLDNFAAEGRDHGPADRDLFRFGARSHIKHLGPAMWHLDFSVSMVWGLGNHEAPRSLMIRIWDKK